MKNLHKVHIKPDEPLFRIEQVYDGKKCHSNYFIEPYGRFQANEMSDTVYEDGDSLIQYHEHTRGIETFMCDAGSIEIHIRGKKTVITRGDIVHLQPYVPHQFHWIDKNTIQRELFQETQMNEDMMAQVRHRFYHPETYNESTNGQGSFSYWHCGNPVFVSVPKEQIPEIRPYESGLSTFKFEGCEIRQKVGRWETKGHKEVWQFCLKSGFELKWTELNPFYNLFGIHEGSVEVRIDGMDKFIAEKRDILHIPCNLAGEIVTCEDTVLFDYNCEGFGLRAMEELYALQVNEPERIKSESEEILQRHQIYLRGRLLK